MFVRSFEVHNYKSLRNVRFEPTPLSCVVGPNASGKTNFADALDFLSEVYRHGLETAVARKGGYENIAYRTKPRTKAPVGFAITIEATGVELESETRVVFGKDLDLENSIFRYSYEFSFVAGGSTDEYDYKVNKERATLAYSRVGQDEGEFREVATVERSASAKTSVKFGDILPEHSISRNLLKILSLFPLKKQDLAIQVLPTTSLVFGIAALIGRFQSFRFSPDLSRMPAVPAPSPRLTYTGGELSAVVDWLQRQHPEQWSLVLAAMREIVPSLETISVQRLHNKTLGLVFSEDGNGRPWNAEEVSDGTIQSLTMLVASADPRNSLIVVEEPENSVHPWIIRTLVDRFREVSESKNVILTTHSPTLIDMLRPSELWITSRESGETKLRRLTDIDPQAQAHWEEGKYKLSELLNSGLVPEAVPGGVI